MFRVFHTKAADVIADGRTFRDKPRMFINGVIVTQEFPLRPISSHEIVLPSFNLLGRLEKNMCSVSGNKDTPGGPFYCFIVVPFRLGT